MRRSCTVADAAAVAAEVRATVPAAASVADAVAAIVEDVRLRGNAAVAEYEARFGDGQWGRVPPERLAAALDALDPEVRRALKLAAANIEAVAAAGLGADTAVTLEQGQSVRLRDVPVRRAAVYAPGGRAPYPSSVLMGAVTARAAGVDEVVVVAPSHPLIHAAAALCQADEVYAMGGAQAIAALAHGTESIRRVDVIVGPGNLYVQEAKRQVSGLVGIDGFAGPSDLCVILTERCPTGPPPTCARRRSTGRTASSWRSATTPRCCRTTASASTPRASTPRSRSPRRSPPSTCS